MKTIKELNLTENDLEIIMSDLNMTREEVEKIDDFHIECSEKDMVKWIYEESEDTLIDMLLDGDTIEDILNINQVFVLEDDSVLFIYE